MPESPFRLPEEYVQHVGRAFSATQKSLFRIPTRHIRTFHIMVTAAEKPLPHAPSPASAPSRFLFHDFPLSKIFTTELHKYAFRDLTERQRKDKHPYTISPRHPPISHLFITPPQRRQPVETQNLASHEKVSTNHTCNNQIIIIEFVAREAQPIASHTHDNQSPVSALLACEAQPIASHTHDNQSPASALLARETQPIASHTHDNHSTASAILACETQPIARHTHHNHSPASALLARETQDFASLLFADSETKQQIMLCYYNGTSL